LPGGLGGSGYECGLCSLWYHREAVKRRWLKTAAKAMRRTPQRSSISVKAMVKIAFNYQGLQQGLRDASREQGTSVSLKDISDRFGAGLMRSQRHSNHCVVWCAKLPEAATTRYNCHGRAVRRNVRQARGNLQVLRATPLSPQITVMFVERLMTLLQLLLSPYGTCKPLNV
jgi:hypothetical protein